MRVIIGLALLSVAFAIPVIPPVTLPEPPQPALEGVELPLPEMPTANIPDTVSPLDIVDISPAMIPQSVMDEYSLDSVESVDSLDRQAPVDALKVVEVPADLSVDHIDEIVSIDSVVKDVIKEVVQDAVEGAVDNMLDDVVDDVLQDAVDAVHVVDNAEANVNEAPYDNDTADVKTGDEEDFESNVDPVMFVDNAQDSEVLEADVPHEEEPVNADQVIVVDYLMPMPAPINGGFFAPSFVQYVPMPIPVYVAYPERMGDNPMLR